MYPLPFLADAGPFAAADRLIADHGAQAAAQAAVRADRSRQIGNHVHFCRWREVERLIDVLALPDATGTRH